MRKAIPHLFADLTAQAEDFHALTVDGQRRDNSRDMQRALVSHLRAAIVAMDAILVEVRQRVGAAHD